MVRADLYWGDDEASIDVAGAIVPADAPASAAAESENTPGSMVMTPPGPSSRTQECTNLVSCIPATLPTPAQG